MQQNNVHAPVLSVDETRHTLRPHHFLLRLAALIPTASLILHLDSLYMPVSVLLTAWLACLVMFVTGSVLTSRPERDLRPGYLHLSVLVTWLTLGVGPALLLLISGSLVATLLLLYMLPLTNRWSTRLLYLSSRVLAHVAILGLPLLFAASIYTTPLPPASFAEAMTLGIAILSAYSLMILLTMVLTTSLRPLRTIQKHWLLETMLLLLVVPLAVIYLQAGEWVFVVVVLLVTLQAYRFNQVAQYRDQLSRRVRELSLLNNIGQSTSSNLVLDEVLVNIYRQVIQVVETSVFYIALYDERQKILDFRLVMAGRKAIRWSPRRLAEGPLETVIQTKAPLRVSAGQSLLVHEMGELTHSARYLTFLGLPLLAGSEVLGVMAVLSDQNATAFDDDEVRLLQTIASQAGLAVRNAVLFTQRADLARKLSEINKSVQRVVFNPDRDNALKAACETAQTITGSDKMAVFLLDEQRRYFQVAFQQGLTAAHQQYVQQLQYAPEQYLDGPVIVSNMKEDPANSDLALRYEYHAYAEIPLRSGSTVKGILVIYYDKPHYYPTSELDLLQVLANQVIAMLDNAEVFQVLEQQTREMAELVDLSRISTATMEMETLVQDVSAILREIFKAQYIALMLIEGDDRRIRSLGGQGGRYQSRLSALDEFRALIHQPHPSPTELQQVDPDLSPSLQTLMQEYNIASLFFAPIQVEGALIGIVSMAYESQRHFAYLDWQFVEMAMNQIAVQVRNVQLYEATEKAMERGLEQISLIEDIARQVTRSLDFNQIIQHMLEAAVKVTSADLVSLAILTEGEDFFVIEERLIDGEFHKTTYQQPRDTGVISVVSRTGQTTIIPDNTQVPAYFTLYPGEYASSLAVPLINGDEIIGVLNLESMEPGFFTEAQAAFLTSLAGHAVISIENARYLEERQYEIDMLGSLRKLALLLANADDLHAVAEAVQATAMDILQADAALFLTYDVDNDRLSLLSHSEAGAEPDAALLERARETIRTSRNGSLYQDHQCYVTVPIKRSNQVFGVLCLIFHDERTLQERDDYTIELLAGQATGHLENAALHGHIRARRDQMRAILDSTRDGMILLDRDMRLVETNSAAQRLLGIPIQDRIGEHFPDMVLHYIKEVSETGYSWDEIQNMARILKLQPHKITRRQFQHKLRNRKVFIEEVGAPVLDDHNEILGRLLVLRDITEEKELEAYREELTRLMVHDLRSPLASMINGLKTVNQLVGMNMDALDVQDVQQLMDSMLDSAKRLSHMVDSLLEIARLESKEVELEQAQVGVSSLVSMALSTLDSSIRQNQIQVEVRIPADLPLVWVDREKVERAIINLLDNALRYTPAASKVLIDARPLSGGRFVQISLADSGPGIPAQERQRVFEKFRRVPGQQPLRGHKGTGLGLALVKAVIESHGGSIKVADKSPLPGACFVFTLPVTAPKAVVSSP